MLQNDSILSPITKPIASEPPPEKIPLRRTICKGSFEDIFLVQLFSRPQQQAASSTNRLHLEKYRLLISSKERMRQEIVTAMIPSHNLGEIRSLKANRAINAVAAISKLLSNDAFAAVVMDKPSNRQIGAAISRTIMAIV